MATDGAEDLGGGGMGRIFPSQRLGVRVTADRWRRLGRDLRDRDRVALNRQAGMAMAHSSEAFYALGDPLEAALVSILIDLVGAVGDCDRLTSSVLSNTVVYTRTPD